MEKRNLYNPLYVIIGIVLIMSSCVIKGSADEGDGSSNTAVVVHDTLYMTQEEWNKFSEDLKKRENPTFVAYDTMYVSGSGQAKSKVNTETVKVVEEAKLDDSSVSGLKDVDFSQVKKFNVVVASLSKEDGVKRLTAAFDKVGIKHIVVKNEAGGLHHFVVYSCDTKEEAAEARKKFIQEYSNRNRSDIWKQFGITMTDSYIWEKR